jgi:hypothetical protein
LKNINDLKSFSPCYSTMLTIMSPNNNNNSDQPLPSSLFEMIGASLSTEEQAAASVVAALGEASPNKRSLDDGSDHRPSKMARGATSQHSSASSFATIVTREGAPTASVPDSAAVLKPYPYFRYRDFSTLPDPDPLVPLTSQGRVPNFPAKMHSILSRPDVADIVAWNAHGRSWRVLKPREFESKVIPTYFEHAKYSSFIRQANGWGFRRATQGRDRNSYYHEMFLRGLPHLCKMMKRPGVSEKQTADPEEEPDLLKISEEKPVPERAQDDSILLHCTLQGGPKARMPIGLGLLSSFTANSPTAAAVQMPQNPIPAMPSISAPQTSAPPVGTTYTNNAYPSQVNNFPNMMPAMDNQSFNNNSYMMTQQPNQPQYQSQLGHMSLPQRAYMHSAPQQAQQAAAPMTAFGGPAPGVSQNQAVTPTMTSTDTTVLSPSLNPMSMMSSEAFQGNSVAAAQFAAGFAAAAALSNQSFREILGQALASYPTNGNTGGNTSGQQVVYVQQQQQVPPQQYQQTMAPSPIFGQQQQQQNHHHEHQQHVVYMQQQQTMMPQYMPASAQPQTQQPQTIQ